MQIVIDIPDTAYQGIINANNASGNWNNDLFGILCKGVANGTPLPIIETEREDNKNSEI